VSAEDTVEQDVPLTEIERMIRRLAEKTWTASRKELRIARTVVLKLKTSEFKILTRSHTLGSPPSSCQELTSIALSLRDRVTLMWKNNVSQSRPQQRNPKTQRNRARRCGARQVEDEKGTDCATCPTDRSVS
jgi:nucleotidyltransferase/DNA polymerase involved in DNA repair